MFMLPLLSIGAIYALIPVIIILILIAAASGLKGGVDLFTLLGFGQIMQMASGFGSGGAGKGISKMGEFRENVVAPIGAKTRITGMGRELYKISDQRKTENAKEGAYLKTPAGQAEAIKLIENNFLTEKGVKTKALLGAAEMFELGSRINKFKAARNPRVHLMEQRKIHTRTAIRNDYAKYGSLFGRFLPRITVSGVADWGYRASRVPVVGMYGAAAAGLIIAARLPFYRAPPPAAGAPVPPPTERWWETYAGSTSAAPLPHPLRSFYMKMYVTGESEFSWRGFAKFQLQWEKLQTGQSTRRQSVNMP